MLTNEQLAEMQEWNLTVEAILKRKIVSLEFADFFLGKYLGSGVSRHVFEYALDTSYVIKIDVSNYNANAMEHAIWETVEYVPKLAQWFAPVKRMSTNARIMMQKKADVNKDLALYPKSVPAFFTDIKDSNYGFIKGKFVCVDYASTLLLDLVDNYKMKKVNWF